MAHPDSSPALPKTPLARAAAARDEPLASPGAPRPRSLIIVAQGELDLWLYLTRTYGGMPDLQILLDRRQGERRYQLLPHTPERRQAERRRPVRRESTLHRQPFLIVPRS
jgi:hypothetical protein